MHNNMEGGRRPEEGESSDNEMQKAVAEKIQKSISELLNRRVEAFVAENVSRQELESAADRVFELVRDGASEAEIESQLANVSLNIARGVMKAGK